MTEPARVAGDLDLLRESLDSARREWQRRYPDAVSDAVLSESLDEVLEALQAGPGEEIRDELRAPANLLAVRLRLLDLARGSYVAGMALEGEGAEIHLERLRRFEEVRDALEPHWDEQLDAGLGGPQAHEMLAEIGHDLRSPLTSILFLSEVLKGTDGIRENPQQVRQLGLIYSGALTMLNIVNNFMELSRGGHEPSDREPTVFSLRDLVESIRRTVQPMADEKGLELRASLEPTGSDRRVGHPVALSRILLNLATNSVKFTDTGHVEVHACEIASGIVEFAVADSGPGIDPERGETIFNVFDPAQDRGGLRLSGSGLGFVIVRKLLDAFDSELEWDSEPGSGTRMRFRIRLAEAHEVQSGSTRD